MYTLIFIYPFYFLYFLPKQNLLKFNVLIWFTNLDFSFMTSFYFMISFHKLLFSIICHKTHFKLYHITLKFSWHFILKIFILYFYGFSIVHILLPQSLIFPINISNNFFLILKFLFNLSTFVFCKNVFLVCSKLLLVSCLFHHPS